MTFKLFKTMERRINLLITNYVGDFKTNTLKRAQELGITGDDNVKSLLQYVCDYNRLTLTAEDFAKRQRIKHVVSPEERCNGQRGAGSQCTRRKQKDKDYCGTHGKLTLCLESGETSSSNKKPVPELSKMLEVWTEDINGILYYVDASGKIYDAEDIVCNKKDPRILGRYNKDSKECEWV